MYQQPGRYNMLVSTTRQVQYVSATREVQYARINNLAGTVCINNWSTFMKRFDKIASKRFES